MALICVYLQKEAHDQLREFANISGTREGKAAQIAIVRYLEARKVQEAKPNGT